MLNNQSVLASKQSSRDTARVEIKQASFHRSTLDLRHLRRCKRGLCHLYA